ncbi:HesA/MoeB/ThiF family protein [Bacteroides congonensis]|uniref:HesA/MoeB/ThiF family protein n=1 Tax=Bacteroides congonensis TaxID=1871006 RepID=UPI003A89C1CE
MNAVLSRGIEPKAMVPASIIECDDNPYYGPLYGYYVSNTYYYNIMPDNARIDNTRIKKLGYIFQENIFELLDENIRAQIKPQKAVLDKELTKAERFRTSETKNNRKDLPEKQLLALKEFVLSAGGNAENIEETLVGYRTQDGLHLIQIATLTEVKIEPYTLKLDVFSRNTGILESSTMLEKRALFIGCGSVGSLVAVELAKAGVGAFMLVDNDVFSYHNICRHQCGIYDVGRYKTDAVADRILQINPYAKVLKFNSTIQDVDRDKILEFCNTDSIIIGGADNREGDLYANRFATQTGASFMSIGCWERAFAGEIFYCLPEGMPTYEDFLSIVGYTSGRITQHRRFYTTEEELEKVSFEPGISADINFVTIIAIKMALDLLNRNNPEYTQRLLPNLTQYTLVCNTNNPKIGGEQAEIFSYPLQVTTSIIVPYAEK